MAKVLILGGGFAGVVAAESLAEKLSDEHQITLVSRTRNFVFYPDLVKLAFGKCTPEDISFDIRDKLLSKRINFIESEVARIHPESRKVTLAHGEVQGQLSYDYLVYALGRRFASERIKGYFEYAHHLLSVDEAIKFGEAVQSFNEGQVVLGQCPGARLPIPVYESAFALVRLLEQQGRREKAQITIISPDELDSHLEDEKAAEALRNSLADQGIALVTDFSAEQIEPGKVIADSGRSLSFDLLMLLPPFRGSSAASYLGITDQEGYINVDQKMKVDGAERVYAAGDCVGFGGPKTGHMAVRQATVAAENVAAEIEGREPESTYIHEIRLVIDEGGSESLYLHKDLWGDGPGTVRQGRFWSWAKWVQKKYWEQTHL